MLKKSFVDKCSKDWTNASRLSNIRICEKFFLSDTFKDSNATDSEV